jgi:transposase InsO family protein
MLREFEPPSWVREVVLADADFPTTPTLKLIQDLGWTYVFAMPRPRKFTNGKYSRDLVPQYASHAYQDMLREHGMVCSMSGKGECLDNAVAERFFGSLKREWPSHRYYETRQEA